MRLKLRNAQVQKNSLFQGFIFLWSSSASYPQRQRHPLNLNRVFLKVRSKRTNRSTYRMQQRPVRVSLPNLQRTLVPYMCPDDKNRSLYSV